MWNQAYGAACVYSQRNSKPTEIGLKSRTTSRLCFETLFIYLDKPKSDSSDDENDVNEWFSRAMMVTISRSSQSFELLYS